jgi:hypothetical protein
MTLTLMKCLALIFSMTLVSAATAGLVAKAAPSASAATVANASAPLPDDIAGKAANIRSFPTFCKIPLRPSNVRTGQSFRQAVVTIRLAGVRLAAQTAPGTFSLENTDGFASGARAEAIPPPPMSPPAGQQTDNFINQARALARAPGPR